MSKNMPMPWHETHRTVNVIFGKAATPPSVLSLLAVYWGGSFLVAVLLLKFALPMFLSSSVDAHGLLVATDSVGYHAEALTMVEKIAAGGWSQWQLAPRDLTMIGLTAAIYALIGEDPVYVIFLSTLFHAIGGVCLYSILRQFTSDWRWAALGSLAYLAMPSSAMWYAQLLKDGYFNAGFLIYALGVVKISMPSNWHDNVRNYLIGFLLVAVGYLVVGMFRPYALSLFLGGFLIVTSIIIAFCLLARLRRTISTRQALIGSLGVLLILAFHVGTKENFSSVVISDDLSINVTGRTVFGKSFWTPKPILPTFIDDRFATIAGTREAYIDGRPDALSLIDRDVKLQSVGEILMYTPRAIQIGLLAPFPDFWFEQGSTSATTIMRRVAGIEMVFAYLSLPGVLFILWRFRGRPALWVLLALAGSVLVVMATATPNLGTLYRTRYAYFLIFVGLGIVGWLNFLSRRD